MSTARQFAMTIGGRQVSKGSLGLFGVIHPFDGKVFAQAPNGGAAELDAAVKAAREALPGWAAKSWSERQETLKKLAGALVSSKNDLASLLSQEQGKGLAQAMGEVMGSAAWLNMAAATKCPNFCLRDDDKVKVEQVYRPIGVAGCITAWNFPIILLHFKISQALLAGCTVVLKPSEYTPLTTLEIGRLYSGILPPGVLNIVCSQDKALGKMMVEHKGIDKISFTGSTETGKHVLAGCGQSLKRCTVELGGNDAAIILPDCDPKSVAPYIFRGALGNSGQICMAIKRVFVHESMLNEFAEALGEECRKNPFGNPLQKGVVYGPIQNAMQYSKVRELLVDAVERGATIVQGKIPPKVEENGGGYLFQPVILKGLDDSFRIVAEEQFGPVVPILSYKTEEEAIERANNTLYGLGGSVWSNNLDKAHGIALRIQSGTVWVNDHGNIVDAVPFGGAKQSGIGCEGSTEGLLGFMQLHVIKTKKKQSSKL